MGSTRKLKIAIVTENFLPKVDGVTRTLARLLDHLKEEGHEALILGPESGMTQYNGFEVRGTLGIPLPCYPGLYLNFFRPLFLSRIIAFKPDVIHFVDPIWLSAQAQLVINYYLPEVACIASYHTNLAMYSDMYGFGFLTNTIWSLQRYLHSQCLSTFCPSQSTSRMLSRHGFSNIRLWPRGVDNALFNPLRRSASLRAQWTSDKVIITYVGRLGWEKNIALLIEAFHGLDSAARMMGSPGCRLVLVGDGPARGDLEVLCGKYELDTVFMGSQHGERLAECFASSDIFAFPSVSETFGQVVLEALASGVPVVGFKSDGISDIVQHGKTGLLLDLDTISLAGILDRTSPTFLLATQQYRELLLSLVMDCDLRSEMGENAVRYAETQKWSDAMGYIVRGYRDVSVITSRRRRSQNMSLNGSQVVRKLKSVISDRRATTTASTTSMNLMWPPMWLSVYWS